MAKWSGWDWISYGLLGFAALGVAISTWGKENPEMFSGLPAIFSSPKWAAVPAVLFTLATIIFIIRMVRQNTPSMSSQDGSAAARSPTITNEPKPLPKMFTAYDIEQRLRAIDELYSLLDSKMIESSTAGEKLRGSLPHKIANGAAVEELDKFADAIESTLENYFRTAGKYQIFPDIHHDAIALVWNPFNLVSSSRNLRAELQEIEQRGQRASASLRCYARRMTC